MVIGSIVQKCAKFVLPKDIITILIVLFILSDLFFIPLYGGITQSSPGRPDIDPLLYVSFFMGYLVGYYINGAAAWVMICLVDHAGDDNGRYTVLYELKDGTTCIADQTNRALLKRWLFGIHHKIRMADGYAKHLKHRAKKERRRQPILRFRYKKLWLNGKKQLDPEIITVLRFFKLKAPISEWKLADANQAEQWQLVKAFETLDVQNDEIGRLNKEIDRLRTEIDIGTTRNAVELNTDFKRGHPVTGYLNEKHRREEEEKRNREREEQERKAAQENKNKVNDNEKEK